MRHYSLERIHILVALSSLLIHFAPGQAATEADTQNMLAGLWSQIDEKTGKVQSLVRIVEIAPEQYEGFIEKIFIAPGEDPNPRCEDCKGTRRNQPVLGMRIITGLKRASRNGDIYQHGEILDPDSGDTYRLKITLLDSGKKLDVRGFVGIALFGRSQIWLRESNQTK